MLLSPSVLGRLEKLALHITKRARTRDGRQFSNVIAALLLVARYDGFPALNALHSTVRTVIERKELPFEWLDERELALRLFDRVAVLRVATRPKVRSIRAESIAETFASAAFEVGGNEIGVSLTQGRNVSLLIARSFFVSGREPRDRVYSGMRAQGQRGVRIARDSMGKTHTLLAEQKDRINLVQLLFRLGGIPFERQALLTALRARKRRSGRTSRARS